MYNWSQWYTNPFMGSLKIFTDMLGYGFFLIPITVIGAALWQQKKDPVAITLYFTASFTILAGTSGAATIWGQYQGIIPLYIVLAAIGWTALIVQTIFIRR
jgi:hypothetical protein